MLLQCRLKLKWLRLTYVTEYTTVHSATKCTVVSFRHYWMCFQVIFFLPSLCIQDHQVCCAEIELIYSKCRHVSTVEVRIMTQLSKENLFFNSASFDRSCKNHQPLWRNCLLCESPHQRGRRARAVESVGAAKLIRVTNLRSHQLTPPQIRSHINGSQCWSRKTTSASTLCVN